MVFSLERVLNGSRSSIIDQVRFAEDSLQKISVISGCLSQMLPGPLLNNLT